MQERAARLAEDVPSLIQINIHRKYNLPVYTVYSRFVKAPIAVSKRRAGHF